MRPLLSVLIFIFLPLSSFAKEDLNGFKYGYLYEKKTLKTETCKQLTESELKLVHNCKKDAATKECPKCEIDSNIRRCEFNGKMSINIFHTEEQCRASLHDSTEGDSP